MVTRISRCNYTPQSGSRPIVVAVTESEATDNLARIPDGTHEVSFEAFGVRIAVHATNSELLERAHLLLPPGWKPTESSEVQQRFALLTEPAGTYEFVREGKVHHKGIGLELALAMLDTELRLYIARKAPDAIFIHAGVVGYHGRTIVLPGMSFSGKTTLVAALVREGAVYYSDEFAVIDENGFVRPYAKPLSLRDDNWIQVEHPVESLGGVAGEEPLRIGAIVVTSYRPHAEWQPRRLSPGEGAMALLANAVPARERPAEVMRAISRSAGGAMVIQSERGEAEAIAPLLLAELDGSPA
jgi:hypothetical protein